MTESALTLAPAVFSTTPEPVFNEVVYVLIGLCRDNQAFTAYDDFTLEEYEESLSPVAAIRQWMGDEEPVDRHAPILVGPFPHDDQEAIEEWLDTNAPDLTIDDVFVFCVIDSGDSNPVTSALLHVFGFDAL